MQDTMLQEIEALKAQLGEAHREAAERMEEAPGVVIPIHHDTGDWVDVMHRCHVPLQTNSKVNCC